MKDARKNRMWTSVGAIALVATVGLASARAFPRRAPVVAAEEILRDAVASPAPPATVGLAGRPVPTSWFKTPAQGRAEMDAMLLSSLRRRALARSVAAR